MGGIYVTSKIRHAAMWREFRNEGSPIISSWIDLVPESENDFRDLWTLCMDECRECSILVAYSEPGDMLKGGTGEIGAALATGHHVILIGEFQGIGTMNHHPLVKRHRSLDHAMKAAKRYCQFVESCHACSSVAESALAVDIRDRVARV